MPPAVLAAETLMVRLRAHVSNRCKVSLHTECLQRKYAEGGHIHESNYNSIDKGVRSFAVFQRGEKTMKYDFMRDAIEMHVHTAPDVSSRKCTDIELMERLRTAGLGGALIKYHYGETAGRAALLRELCPELKLAGGITLNRAVGGINASAVEACGKLGGRFVWFPTMDALK